MTRGIAFWRALPASRLNRTNRETSDGNATDGAGPQRSEDTAPMPARSAGLDLEEPNSGSPGMSVGV